MSESVYKMFSDIAPNYDRTNSVLSLGIHHLWRRAAVRASGARRGNAALDCATGTGDLALALKKAVGKEGVVVGTDFNADMLSSAPGKGQAKGLDVRWEVADVMNLPYADATFDIATIAFGIRNVDDPVRALSEMARVCKPSGRVVVLEFGQPRGIIGLTFRLYSRYIIPFVGGLLTGNKKAYEYLPATAAAFPSGNEFLKLMQATGRFSHTTVEPLTGGIAYLYSGAISVGLR
ncbi:MAG: bifunctional demethylmenaquinone methyltransferase/2-methoxy-6-polyprenyl-1,4-benzoquinol methylase UbiE [bacterium]|nr:bifunctional demethylmenaquinone methyltransferase/2-methoxy-6-polyprenyl-1,4-benzoquinol methylase UbiE [bacterium]